MAEGGPYSPTQKDSEQGHPGTVLLVEDNADDIELATRALKRSGFSQKIVTVRDGMQALDYLMRRGVYEGRVGADPALVLLDLKLPRVSGLEVLAQVRSNPKLRNLPIVMLTSSDHERDMAEAHKLGVNSYIRKPTDFSEFVQLLTDLGNYWFSNARLPDRDYLPGGNW